MANKLRQDKREAVLSTPLGQDVLAVSRFDAGEGLSDLFEYRVEAVSSEAGLNFDDAIGRHCWVTFKGAGGNNRVFDGLLVEAQWLGLKDPVNHAYRLVLKPWLWMLSRTTDCRIFANRSVPDIVREIFDDNGFSDYRLSLHTSYPTLEYCVQYRETDLAFVSRLMEEYGIYYFFEHEAGKHTMMLVDAKASHDSIPGYSSINYVPLTASEMINEDRIYRLTAQRRLRTGKVALTDYDYLKPNTNISAKADGRAGYARADMEYFDYPGRYTETADGEKLARVRLEAEQAMDNRRYAAGDVVNIFPGGKFTLARHPTDSENVEYLVVRATHSFVAQSYRSGPASPEDEATYFGNYELLPSEYTFRAPLLTEKPVIHGPQTAKVVGKAGEEIDVDKYGRITVQFYWDRRRTPSRPVRIAQVWSGKSWGGIFIPRIEQEVVVVFLEGDPDQPLVVGTVYNGDHPVPYDLPANQTMGGIKSDTTKGSGGYNELVFEDKKGSEIWRGHAQKNLEFRILNDETWKIDRDSATDVGRDIKVDAGQTITITAGTKIELKVGTNNIVIDPKGITITGLVTQVNGSTLLELKGGMITIN